MRLVAVVAMLVAGCSREPYTWRGIPSGATCAPGDSFREERCVVDGRAYLCIRDTSARVVQCAVMTDRWPS